MFNFYNHNFHNIVKKLFSVNSNKIKVKKIKILTRHNLKLLCILMYLHNIIKK